MQRSSKICATALLCLAAWPAAAKECYAPDARSQERAYSRAVVTEGGRTIWLGGQTPPLRDALGKSLAGDFDAQVRAVFAGLDQTLQANGGRLSDIVTMTVFVSDMRFGDRFVELKKEAFKECFPASALVAVSAFARPGVMIEIQGVAVVDGK